MKRIELLPVVVCLGLFADGSWMAAATLTTLHVFHDTDGNAPVAALVLGTNGNFYGTTQAGGTNSNCPSGCGSVFRFTPSGVVTTLHSFDGSDGKEPLDRLVQGSDGNLYGTTSGGPLAALNCSGGCGTVFRITTNGVFTSLHAFSGPDGRQPRAGLVEGSDGNFYGTASMARPSTAVRSVSAPCSR